MQPTGIRSGISGHALIRAADAMLRCLGGEEIGLLLPLLGIPGDPAALLGLVDPGVEEVRISPAIVRNLPTESNGPRRRVEFLVPASAIEEQVSARDFVDARQLVEAALGITYEGEVFHIEGFVTENFSGTAYLYRIVAVE
jgi:hypothetical protein